MTRKMFSSYADAEFAYQRADREATLFHWALFDVVNQKIEAKETVPVNGDGLRGTYQLCLSRPHHPHGGIVTVLWWDAPDVPAVGTDEYPTHVVTVRYLSDPFTTYPITVQEAVERLRAVGHKLMFERNAPKEKAS